MKNWKIREANINDENGLKECMISAYTSYVERLKGAFLPPLEADYKEEILNFPVWVVEENNVIIGGLVLFFEKEKASILNVAVHPKAQGRGLGKFLINFAEKEAIKNECVKINLATHILLTENILFYEKLGFEVTDSDENKIYMMKNL